MNIIEQNKEKINGILETFDRTLIFIFFYLIVMLKTAINLKKTKIR